MTADRAVAVTGLGAVSGLGHGVDALWQGSLAARSAITELGVFDPATHRTRVAGGVTLAGDSELSRADRFALAAAAEATAGVDPSRLERAGVFFGSSTGGLLEGERFYTALTGGRADVELNSILSQQTNGPGDAVARALGAGGPVVTLSTACTSANVAIAAALDALRAGEVELAIAGGSDELCEITYAGFNALRAVDPAHTRPYRRERAGLSMGEGAGVVVLETLEAAARRGARVWGELAGAGSSCDAHHMSAPSPNGEGLVRAIRSALADAGVEPADVTFVNGHGTGTPHNDEAEAAALRAVLAAPSPPLTSTKSLIGHTLGACGGLEAVVTVLSITHRLLPPTYGADPADPELEVDLVLDRPRELPVSNVGLSINLAFGGNNCVLVFRSPS